MWKCPSLIMLVPRTESSIESSKDIPISHSFEPSNVENQKLNDTECNSN